MNNPFMRMLQGMAQQSMGNGQQFAQDILKNNPKFAQQIQGQNLQTLATNMLKQRGIDVNQVTQMFGRK